MVEFDNATLLQAVTKVRKTEMDFGFCENTKLGKNKKLRTRNISREGATNIGGLSESTLHLVLKYCIEPDNSFHEVAFCGCELDILKDNTAFEIQTKNFAKIRKKLEKLPEEIDLTVVFPVIEQKRIFFLDPKSGEISGGRKSPKKESSLMLFKELIYICEQLKRHKLHFAIVTLRCDDYKLVYAQNSKNKKSVRYNRIPTSLSNIENFNSYEDYFKKYIPCLDLLGDSFTTLKFSQISGYDINVSRLAVRLLCLLGYIECIGKENRYFLYKKIKNI